MLIVRSSCFVDFLGESSGEVVDSRKLNAPQVGRRGMLWRCRYSCGVSRRGQDVKIFDNLYTKMNFNNSYIKRHLISRI